MFAALSQLFQNLPWISLHDYTGFAPPARDSPKPRSRAAQPSQMLQSAELCRAHNLPRNVRQQDIAGWEAVGKGPGQWAGSRNKKPRRSGASGRSRTFEACARLTRAHNSHTAPSPRRECVREIRWAGALWDYPFSTKTTCMLEHCRPVAGNRVAEN